MTVAFPLLHSSYFYELNMILSLVKIERGSIALIKICKVFHVIVNADMKMTIKMLSKNMRLMYEML